MPAVWDPPLTNEPPWPVAGDGPFILLIDAQSTMERELIKGWIERNRPDGVRVDTAYIPAGRMLRRRKRTDPRLEARLAQYDDPIMIPLRVAWLAGVALGAAAVRYFTRTLVFNAARQIEYELRNDIFGHLLKLPQSFYFRWRTGDIMSRCVNDLTSVRLLLGPGLLNVIQTPIMLVSVIAV